MVELELIEINLARLVDKFHVRSLIRKRRVFHVNKVLAAYSISYSLNESLSTSMTIQGITEENVCEIVNCLFLLYSNLMSYHVCFETFYFKLGSLSGCS